MKVFVYYNLHKLCWSVKALEGENKGRVVLHTQAILLTNAQGRVSEAGRQRVIREQRKNVHAGIVGYVDLNDLTKGFDSPLDEWVEFTYNPYKFSSFVEKEDTTREMGKGLTIFMTRRKVYGKID